MSSKWTESELKAALEEEYQPAPWLLANSMAAVRRGRRGRPAYAWMAGVAAAVLALSSIAVFQFIRQQETSNAIHNAPTRSSLLPQPIPQAITRTTPGAQVAWLWLQSQGHQPYLLAIDTNGRVVARLNESPNSYGIWRSADGATLYVPASNEITAYAASDGRVERSYVRNPGTLVSDAFSADGRWLALLLLNNGLQLQVIDLGTGSSQVRAVPHDASAKLPGLTCSPEVSCASTVAWGLVVFGGDSSRLFTLTDWGGPVRLSAFSLATGKLVESATALDGQQGRKFAACGGPAMTAKVIDRSMTLVAFCHIDGSVSFFNLTDLTSSGVIQAHQDNPFWLSPIFTPDGQLLYLHQPPGFGDSMQVVDLANRKLLGPVAIPTNTQQSGPLAWLITNAYAGWVATTVPISPDGLRLYSATNDGVMVLRIPDLKPLAKLAGGLATNEVWISGNGRTVYVTSADGKSLLVIDGSSQHKVSLPDMSGGFIASEHG